MEPKVFSFCVLPLLLLFGYAPTRVCLAADDAPTVQAKPKIDELLAKQPDVPDGVVYKKPLASVERAALETLASHPLLSGDRQFAADEILSVPLICGPGLWQHIRDDGDIKKIVKGNVNFNIPNANGTQNLKGKLFQTKEEVAVYWKAFVKAYGTDNSTIRRPTSEELRIYWAMIPYDITEPLFVVESNSAAILVQLIEEKVDKGGKPRKLKIAWIDDYKDLRMNAPPASQPTK
jgi:hypothetical protein